MVPARTPSAPKNMADIADMLGVTAVSVSNALRNSPLVSKELRDRVHQVVKETGFRPRDYRQRKQRSVGRSSVPAGRIAVLNHEAASNGDPVAHIIMNSVMKRLSAINIPFDVIECEELYARPELIKDCGGVIFYYTFRPWHADILKGLPQVAIMHEEIDLGPMDSYKPSEPLAGKLAAQYLLSQGFTHTLLTWEHMTAYKPATHPRLEGFRATMKEAGARVHEIAYGRGDDTTIYIGQVKDWLAQQGNRGGIFAFCDQVAYHVCTVLDFLGLKRRPGELEVISCDNTYLTRQLRPPLPVVDSHIAEIAERAVDGLMWRIANPQACLQEVVLKPELVLPSEITKGKV